MTLRKYAFTRSAVIMAMVGMVVMMMGMRTTVAQSVSSPANDLWTALDEYVWKRPNPVYAWKVVSTAELDDVHVAVLNMTSQAFLSSTDVDRPIWYHFMVVAVPKPQHMNTDRALMYIGGGSNRPNQPPSPNDPKHVAVQAAKSLGCVAMYLHHIPNEPLLFSNDTVLPGKYRTEDAIIAWTWDMFVQSKGRNPFILARMPMVKASILAMDTVETYVKEHRNMEGAISKWAVAGESKRGWTAWLVAATDYKRVDTVIPMVIDIVDTEKVLLHIRASLCGWPEAMNDYVVQGITDRIGSDEIRMLFAIIDPLVYNERLAHVDKFLVNAGNDQFFWPDGSVFGYHKLLGPKSIRYIPNTGHYLGNSDALPVILSYLATRSRDQQRIPRYGFKHSYTSDGLQIQAWLESNAGVTIRPVAVNLWTITNTKARDFRLEVVGPTWESKELSATVMEWNVFVPNPSTGYRAAMMEFIFPDQTHDHQGRLIKFTTSAYITPNTTPCHEQFTG